MDPSDVVSAIGPWKCELHVLKSTRYGRFEPVQESQPGPGEFFTRNGRLLRLLLNLKKPVTEFVFLRFVRMLLPSFSKVQAMFKNPFSICFFSLFVFVSIVSGARPALADGNFRLRIGVRPFLLLEGDDKSNSIEIFQRDRQLYLVPQQGTKINGRPEVMILRFPSIPNMGIRTGTGADSVVIHNVNTGIEVESPDPNSTLSVGSSRGSLKADVGGSISVIKSALGWVTINSREAELYDVRTEFCSFEGESIWMKDFSTDTALYVYKDISRPITYSTNRTSIFQRGCDVFMRDVSAPIVIIGTPINGQLFQNDTIDIKNADVEHLQIDSGTGADHVYLENIISSYGIELQSISDTPVTSSSELFVTNVDSGFFRARTESDLQGTVFWLCNLESLDLEFKDVGESVVRMRDSLIENCKVELGSGKDFLSLWFVEGSQALLSGGQRKDTLEHAGSDYEDVELSGIEIVIQR